MIKASRSVSDAFAAYDLDPTQFCYFGEAVLLAAYRGRGAGVRFFNEREAHARELGLDFAAFCAVVRDPADRRKPADYVPLDAFWRRRGYTPYPNTVHLRKNSVHLSLTIGLNTLKIQLFGKF